MAPEQVKSRKSEKKHTWKESRNNDFVSTYDNAQGGRYIKFQTL